MARAKVLHNCNFKGCLRTVLWPRIFWLPPEGWRWCEGVDIAGVAIVEGMYCEHHGGHLEKLMSEGRPAPAGYRKEVHS